MSVILTSVPFFTADIEMSEILAATSQRAFELEGRPIAEVIDGQPAQLQEYNDLPGHYLLYLANGEFVEFIER